MTLVRKVLERNEISLDQKFDELGKRIGEELLTPTTIYVKPVLKLLKQVKATGMVDVTGGGLRNFVRLKKGVRFDLSKPLKPQPIFGLLQELGNIEEKEMYQTFNMGMGFAIIVRERDAKEAVKILGKGARVVGEVDEGEGVGSSRLDLSYSAY
jgi:phosphoribosylformylglycinamidine cyclo-ligase